MQIAPITAPLSGIPDVPQLCLLKGMRTFCHFSRAVSPGHSRLLSLASVESITVLGVLIFSVVSLLLVHSSQLLI